MDERSAVLGLVLLAALAWALPPALRAVRGWSQPPATVIYAGADSDRLFWSPARYFPEGAAVDGGVLGADGSLARPVGGWRGLLLGNPLDLNGAAPEDLEALPGIGPKTAEAIRDERELRGGFRSVPDLLAVKGVGPVTLERLRPLVRVGDPGREGPSARSGREPQE